MCLRFILTVLLCWTFTRNHTFAGIGMPMIQISHDEAGEDYPEMQEEVHLEDFFWTGSGDGPPDYLKKVHTGISKGKEVILKTETVVATVYVDGNNEIDIPICLDCYPDDGGGGIGGNWGLGGGNGGESVPLNYSATDRRYWLLTVMSGFYTQKDNPMLEEKLARLYRLAFTRQQSRHLGINGAQQISGIVIQNNRDRRAQTVQSEEHAMDISSTTKIMTTTVPTTTTTTATATTTSTTVGDILFDKASEVEILNMANDIMNHPKPGGNRSPINTNSELATSSEENDISTYRTSTEAETTNNPDQVSTDPTSYVTLAPWEFIQQNGASQKQTKAAVATQLKTPRLQQIYTPDRVRVIIHNITQITEDDVQNGVTPTTYDADVNEKIDERPIANQTELIYTVLVNGRPVLATTAANDMKLVSESEVSDVIGKKIFMKAEPYLREPQATPLAPATRSGGVGFFDSIQNNTALVIVSSLAILLLLLLLLALLLIGHTRNREKMSQVKRASSRNELLTESQSMRPASSGTMIDTGRSTVQSRDVGIQNFSFEHENGHGSTRAAHISFPGPPNNGSRRDSITSSDNTSDSSVYCPINPPTADVQRMLDEKAANLFEKHQRRHRSERHQYDRAEGRDEAVYTSVIADKKREKGRHKAKRRYLSENRVGSLETSPVQRSQHYPGEDAIPDSPDGDGLRPTYQNFEHTEAYNPHNNYHRNKLLHQKSIFKDKEYAHVHEEQVHTTEAINREIIRALQPSEKSSDTGSIGSFLSMASVKAFPKSALPEPLNRVLDPVFVTYYDNADESIPTAVHQTAANKSGKSLRKYGKSVDASTVATTASIHDFPSPKAPLSSSRLTSQSDNPDPGVVGPIVWERHKKGLSEELENDDLRFSLNASNFSPIQDPAAMRNHYEVLLEGAIQMYSSQDDLPMPLPTCDFASNRRPTKRESRGSSAGLSSYSAKSYNRDTRPATAQPDKTPKSNQSTQPPSPTLGAWSGSVHGSHSPLVRPMSAGPFHRPEPLNSSNTDFSRSSKNRGELSAAPLIEAIQHELRKFKQDDI